MAIEVTKLAFALVKFSKLSLEKKVEEKSVPGV